MLAVVALPRFAEVVRDHRATPGQEGRQTDTGMAGAGTGGCDFHDPLEARLGKLVGDDVFTATFGTTHWDSP